jgi:hypothetical protein
LSDDPYGELPFMTMPSETAVETTLLRALQMLTGDLLFVLGASGVAEESAWKALAEQRGQAWESAVKGTTSIPTAASGWQWILTMSVTTTTVQPPWFLPMREAVEKGLTLTGGAGGLRSLFTSKPSDKETARVRRLGGLALRATTAVLVADGALSPEEEHLRELLAHALGLPADERSGLLAEAPPVLASLELPTDLDSKLAGQLMRGAWRVAAQDGLDTAEEDAIALLAGRMGVPMQEAANERATVRAEIDEQQIAGRLAVDCVRYLLGDRPHERKPLAQLTASLTLPVATRPEALRAIEEDGPLTIGHKLSLDRKRKNLCLAMAWTAALHGNPTQARRAELCARHDRIAADLGIAGDALRQREAVERWLDGQLSALARAAGM